MSRLLVAVVVGAAVVAASVVAVVRARTPAERLPDLVQVKPAAVRVDEAAGEQRLVFLSAVENIGVGPVVLEGRRANRDESAMEVEQIVERSDGSTRSYSVDAELRYVSSETHAHWHLLGFERYELRAAADGRLAAPDRKTGFCLGDRYDADSTRELANEPSYAVWTDECGRHEPDLLRVREGISPGYGDDYVPSLEGQFIVLDGVPAGRYRLVHHVNPQRTLRESDYANNAASVVLDLRWSAGAPVVTVLD